MEDSEIYNIGFSMASDFGQHWIEPIQERLSKLIPSLTIEQLNKFNKVCTSAREHGNKFIYKKLESLANQGDRILNVELEIQFNHFMIKKYPWISKSNLSHLYSQGCYYAYKDGLGGVLGN